MYVGFYCFWLKDSDIILAMDWLSFNKVILDCEKKRVLQAPCNSEMRLIFQGLL